LIAVDTNLLVYAHRAESEFHERASVCVRALAEGRTRWGIPWPCVHEFIAIVTHPRIYDPPTPQKLALAQVDAWFGSPSLVALGESDDHWTHLRRVLTQGKVLGPRVHDARIAALCLSHGVRELWTADRDFSRFSELKTRNPLTSA
jgi:uncharacterized protein